MGIDSGSLLFKKVFAGKASSDNTRAFFDEGSFANARLSVFSSDVWSEAHLIPTGGIGNPTGSVSPGGVTSSGVVAYYSASGFSYLPGTGVDGPSVGYSSSIKDWIPFNFGNGIYNYILTKNDGSRIFPGDTGKNWTFDTEAGVLIFHDGNPSNVSATSPPSMSAYAYIGKKLSEGINSTTSSYALTASSLQNNLNYSLTSLTASSGLFFSSSGIGPKNYVIDYAKFYSASSNVLVPSSGSLTITASGIKVEGDLNATGSIILGGSLSFSGFNFSEETTSVISGSSRFGTQSIGPLVQTTRHEFTGSITVSGSGIFPDISGTIDLGSATQKFNNLYATNTFFGGVHEINLETEGLDQMQEGTVLTLQNGTLHPCKKEADPLVMGIVSKGTNYPIVLGAEPILITGKIKEGDYIITSKIKGHGKGINPKYIYNKQLFGKIIAQAIEGGHGKSYIIKAMIRKM